MSRGPPHTAPPETLDASEKHGERRELRWETVTTTTSEWGVQAALSTKVLGAAETSFSSHYKESVSTSNRVSSTTTVPVNPGGSSWLMYAPPVYRIRGDFTVKIAGNIWKVTGVTFDLPMKDDGRLGMLIVEQRANGDADIPTGLPVVKVG